MKRSDFQFLLLTASGSSYQQEFKGKVGEENTDVKEPVGMKNLFQRQRTEAEQSILELTMHMFKSPPDSIHGASSQEEKADIQAHWTEDHGRPG